MPKLHSKDADGIAALIADGKPFATNAEFSGRPGPLGFMETGYLPAEWHATAKGSADYVVFSYGTPIAWREPGIGWVRPLVKYSVSTGRHQDTIDAAIGKIAPEHVEDIAYEGARVRA
jgi:hypothetical protein